MELPKEIVDSDKLVVYLGKPPIINDDLSDYIELARKVRGSLIINPVKKDYLLGENDELFIEFNDPHSLETIINEKFRIIYVTAFKNGKETVFEYNNDCFVKEDSFSYSH